MSARENQTNENEVRPIAASEQLADGTTRFYTRQEHPTPELDAEAAEVKLEMDNNRAKAEILKSQGNFATDKGVQKELEGLDKAYERARQKRMGLLEKSNTEKKFAKAISGVSRFHTMEGYEPFEPLLSDAKWKEGFNNCRKAVESQNLEQLNSALKALFELTKQQANSLPEDSGVGDKYPKGMRIAAMGDIQKMLDALPIYPEEDMPWKIIKDEFGIKDEPKKAEKK